MSTSQGMMRTKVIFPLLLFASCFLLRSAVAAGEQANETIVFTDCHPETGDFLCQIQHECIPGTKVCDKKKDCTDGTDEFPNCEKSCQKVRCKHGCVPNLNPDENGICFCPAGFKASGINKTECNNINECEVWGTCSQLCSDINGGFQCSCMDGFELNKNNSTQCTLKDPNAKIVFATKTSVKYISLSTSRTRTIHDKPGQPVGVTFDATGEFVYWTDVSDKMEAIYRSKLDGSDQKVIVDTGLVLAEGIAFDWVAGNIYFTDSNLSHIGVCDKDGNACTILIQEQMDKPREIALHPSKGKLFWTDWGTEPAIITAGMDGSIPLPIVTTDLKWPNGLAVDHGNQRLYWMDARTDVIETSNLDGVDRRIIRTTGLRHPFSMDVFGDTVYWSDWTLQQVQSCNKFTGEDHHIISLGTREQINGVSVYHPAAQQKDIRNQCLNKACSHICVLTPSKSYRCLCPVGMVLGSDRKKCEDDPMRARLFVAEGNTVKQMHFHSIGNSVLFGKKIEGLATIGAIAYNPLNRTFILFDTHRRKLITYNSTSHKLETLVSRHLDSVKGIDIDTVGHNLYWADAGKRTVEVMSLRTGARAVLYTDEDHDARPFDIIAVPPVQSIFVAIVGRRQGKIVKMSMDGNDIHVLATIPDGEPTALAYNHEFDHIFWCDARQGTIEHMTQDGEVRFGVVARTVAPFSIAIYGNRLYWTDRSSTSLNSIILNTDVLDSPIFIGDDVNATVEVSTKSNFFAYLGVVDNDLGLVQDMIESHLCSPKPGSQPQCSHICLIGPDKNDAMCVCPEGMQLDRNKRECVPLKDCLIGQFTCNDGTCISMDLRCDKFNDCSKGEDELNCTSALTCRVSDFVCKSDQSCIAGLWHCDGEEDCHDGSDEKDCPNKDCPNAGDFKCALGRCIPNSWRCDHVVDCPDTDHSDEDGCNFSCGPGQFKCGAAGGHDCISKDWVCDGEPDCIDESDEHHDCFAECSSDEFRCMNQRCIRKRLVCNGRDDCDDNSDEVQCPLGAGSMSAGFPSGSGSVIRGTTITFNGSTTMPPSISGRSETSCPSDKYWCFSGECLSFLDVCNGPTDCADGSDEGDHCEQACGLDNECSQRCNKTPAGPVCTCLPGYSLSKENSKTCDDIDECSAGKMCDHYCQNVKGSFKCTCHEQYVLKSDHITCKAKGNPPLFVYAASSSTIFVSSQDMKLQKEIRVSSGLSGLDVNSHNRSLYWTNGRKGIIGRSFIDTNSSETLIKGLTMPGVIAYDWISNNAIIIDNISEGREKKRRLAMKICSLNENPKKRGCAILYLPLGHEVTSMAVAPQQNYVFWTVLSYNHFQTTAGAIRRGAMDATGVATLASDKVINPTALVVDHVFQRVFWLDTGTRTVEVVNFDGTKRAVIISSGVSTKVNTLAVFENWVMWSDDGKNIRCRTDMQSDCMRVKIQNTTDARYLVLLQQSLQPTGIDPCQNNTCSFICTGKAKKSVLSSALNPISSTCFCPEGFKGKDSNHTVCTVDEPRNTKGGSSSFNVSPRNSKTTVVPSVNNNNNISDDDDDDDDDGDNSEDNEFGSNIRNAVPVSDESGSDSQSSQMATVVTATLVVLAIIAVIAIGGFVYYQRNGQRKILVRPYVQTWVKYVNDPMQRWRGGNRREPLTDEHQGYDEVYAGCESDHNYANPVYEELDVAAPSTRKGGQGGGGLGGRVKIEVPRSQADSGIMTLMDGEPAGSYSDDEETTQDGHYHSYSQRDKLLDNEIV